MLDDAVVMVMEELVVVSLACAQVGFRGGVSETERVGLDGVALGDGPGLQENKRGYCV